MKAIMINTGERSSQRFELLCEHLKMDEDISDINLVFCHLMIWFLHWSMDPETDSGIFWNVSDKRLGLWAEWSKPLLFGRALVESGYCQPVRTVYPEELTRGREGYVVRGALDASWHGVHKHRANAAELVLFLADSGQRARQAANYKVMGPIPAGWLDAPRPPELLHSDSIATPEEPRRPPAPSPSGSPEERKRNNNGSGSRGKHSGNPKSWDMFDVVRSHKYDNPLLALKALDDHPNTVKVWLAAVENHLSEVQTLLSEITESESEWRKIGSPAALVMSRIRKLNKG